MEPEISEQFVFLNEKQQFYVVRVPTKLGGVYEVLGYFPTKEMAELFVKAYTR